MTDQNVDIFLEHYGVKGMKWGIRNDLRSSKNKKLILLEKQSI